MWGHPVSHECMLQLQLGDLIIPHGSALLQVLEPSHVVGIHDKPAIGLPIFHDLLKMGQHL